MSATFESSTVLCSGFVVYELNQDCSPPDTSAPTTGPTQHDMCPVLVLNFNDLTPGDYIHDQLWLSHGVNITAIRKNSLAGFTPINGVHVESGGGAMVFDTLTPTGKTGQSLCDPYDGDTDLGSPNEVCGYSMI